MSLEDEIVKLQSIICDLIKKIDGICLYQKTIYNEKFRLIPITEWNKHHSWPKIGGLRNIVFNKDNNGFNKVIRKIGKRVMICEKSFFEWADSNPIIKNIEKTRRKK